MRIPPSVRWSAAPALARCASTPGLSFEEAISEFADVPAVRRLCVAALSASIEAGNVQEQRAEAEAKVRCGWTP